MNHLISSCGLSVLACVIAFPLLAASDLSPEQDKLKVVVVKNASYGPRYMA